MQVHEALAGQLGLCHVQLAALRVNVRLHVHVNALADQQPHLLQFGRRAHGQHDVTLVQHDIWTARHDMVALADQPHTRNIDLRKAVCVQVRNPSTVDIDIRNLELQLDQRGGLHALRLQPLVIGRLNVAAQQRGHHLNGERNADQGEGKRDAITDGYRSRLGRIDARDGLYGAGQ